MNLKELYRKKSQDFIAKGKIPWFHPERIENQSIVDSLIEAKKYVKGVLLDVGCGDKPYKIIFSGRANKYIGVDLNVSAGRVDIFASAIELPFKSNSFDTALSTQVIEHSEEPKVMLSEIYRVLKKESFLILTAPMSWKLHEEPRDYYRYTKYGLKYLFESAGFKVIFIRERTGFWGLFGQRMSSHIYFLGGKPGNIAVQFIKLVFCGFLQDFCLLLDRFDKAGDETLGYFAVAKK